MRKFFIFSLIIFTIICSQVKAETGEELVNMGNSLFTEGKYKEALVYFDKALEQSPDLIMGWTLQGMTLLKLERYDEAEVSFDKVMELTEGSPDIWHLKGLALYKQKDYSASILYFDKVLEWDPECLYSTDYFEIEYISPWHCKGMAHYRLQEYEKALPCFEQATTVDTEYYPGWHYKGETLKKLGRYVDSKEAFRIEEELLSATEGLTSRSTLADEWFLKGHEYYVKGIWSKSIEWFEKALEEESAHGITYLYLGMVNYKKGDNSTSLDNITTAIELGESGKDVSGINMAEAYSCKALILADAAQYHEALILCDKAIEINPEFTEGWFGKGICLCHLQNYEEGLACLDKVIEINPEYADAWFYKGMVCYGRGKTEDSKKFFNKVIELDPTYSDAYYYKGVILFHQGKHSEARECYDRAVKLAPQKNYTWYN